MASKAETPLHFAEIRVFGTANNQCQTDKCEANQFLLKSGRCQACPPGYVQDPTDKTSCVYGKYIREIKCKRGHRVDQLKITNFEGEAENSHNGAAGGAWREKDQIVQLKADEYVRRVDGHHIRSGHLQGQLAKIVYFTNKDRMISCFYKHARYNTEKKSFNSGDGKYIQFVHQHEDPNTCCGRVTSVETDAVQRTFAEALDQEAVATCAADQYLLVEGEKRTCTACARGQKRHPDSIYKCQLSCGDYTYLNADATECLAETCTVYESLGEDGKCHTCAQAQSVWAAGATLTAVPLTNAQLSSTWCCKHGGNMLVAGNAIDKDMNKMAHSAGGRGHWWSADFEEGSEGRAVSKVKITNRQDCCGQRLKGARIYIDDFLCGTIPNDSSVQTKSVHEITCDYLEGLKTDKENIAKQIE